MLLSQAPPFCRYKWSAFTQGLAQECRINPSAPLEFLGTVDSSSPIRELSWVQLHKADQWDTRNLIDEVDAPMLSMSTSDWDLSSTTRPNASIQANDPTTFMPAGPHHFPLGIRAGVLQPGGRYHFQLMALTSEGALGYSVVDVLVNHVPKRWVKLPNGARSLPSHSRPAPPVMQ